MSLEYRSGRWIVVYYPNGRWGRKERLYLPEGITEDEAREIDRIKRASIQDAKADKPKPRGGETVAVLFPKYMEWYSVHRSPVSLEGMEHIYRNHIGPILGRETVEKLSAEHILLYKQVRKKKKPVAATVNKELAHISGFLRWAADNGYITARQFHIERLSYKRPIPVVLTPDEVRRIIDATPPFYRALFLCLYTLGLRINEARNLKWEDIDLEGKRVRVKQKGGTWKILPLPAVTQAALSTIPPVDRSPYVFQSRYEPEAKQRPVRTVSHVLRESCKKAGIKKRVTAHLFRHSVATHLMGAGVNLRVIQRFLGHADIDTTEWYTHVSLGHLEDASDAIEIWHNLLATDNPHKY